MGFLERKSVFRRSEFQHRRASISNGLITGTWKTCAGHQGQPRLNAMARFEYPGSS